MGRLGEIGSFVAADRTCYPRRSRVIVRSTRRLEVGEVLAPPGPIGRRQVGGRSTGETAPWNRRGRKADRRLDSAELTEADKLLALRLERNRQAALAACAASD